MGKTTNTHLFDVFGTSDLSTIDFLWPRGPQGADSDPRGTRGAPRAPFRHPYWRLHNWTLQVPHVCPGGVLPTMRKGVYRMAWSFNPMEVSPLDLRSVTVLPRALLEVSPDHPVGRRRQQQQQQNNPANINSPLQTSPPGWFVNPFGHPLTLIEKTRKHETSLFETAL